MNDNLLIELIGDLQTRIDEQDHKLDLLIVHATQVLAQIDRTLHRIESFLTPQ